MHPNIIFIIYNYILINAIPNNKKKHFKVKLILNLKKRSNQTNSSKLSKLNLFLKCSHMQITSLQFESLH